MLKAWRKNEEKDQRLDFMTDEQIRMIDDLLTKIEQNRGHMNDYYDEWEEIEEAYAMEQPIVENRPNSRVNIMNANIEGQVTALVEQNLAVVCRGEGPSDEPFSDWARIGLDWALRKNRIKKLLERHERRREMFGPAWFKLYWDSDAIKGFGLPVLTCPPINSVFVDNKIYDYLNLQEADYIAEVMMKSKSWAEQEYGDAARHIFYGGADRASIFTKEKTTDDEDAFWLIQVWMKTDGMLRLIEFSDDGVLLDDSFSEWDGKKFVEKENKEPFYRYNKYPYFLTTLYYEEGKLYGFGDGKLLRPLQDMINDLYDQIRRAARPNRVFFDPGSEVDLQDLDEDDGPVPCFDPNQTIKVVEVGKVNPALWQLLVNVHQEVQRVTRFSELMMGQNTRSKTATEASIQHQQGNTATDHKKIMLQETLVEVCEYMLDLMMENYEGARAFRIDENKSEYEWIDFRQMDNVPMLIPAPQAFVDSVKMNNPGAEMPQWRQLVDAEGNGMTKSVDLDIEISIGAGLPKNKAFLYQMLEKLAAMVVEGKNVISWQEIRGFIEDFLGIPLQDGTEVMPMQLPAQMPGSDLMPSANTTGLTANNNPQRPSGAPDGGMM